MPVPEPLISDETCRVCFHVHRSQHLCAVVFDEPGPDGPVRTVCDCETYVDLEAESRIIVTEQRPFDPASSEHNDDV